MDAIKVKGKPTGGSHPPSTDNNALAERFKKRGDTPVVLPPKFTLRRGRTGDAQPLLRIEVACSGVTLCALEVFGSYPLRLTPHGFLPYALPVLRSPARREEGWMLYALCDSLYKGVSNLEKENDL